MIMGASVFISLSRGGISALVASLGLVGVYAAVRSSGSRLKRVIAAVALLILAAVVWLGWQPVVKELGTLADIDPAGDSRTEATLATLRLFRTSPVLGCGFGSFQHVFPHFQSPTLQFGRWLHAHNDYAQLLAEGGIVGAILAGLVTVTFVGGIGRRLSNASSEGRLFVGGLAVGFVAVALHSFVDYGLHKPANPFLLAALCGMSIAAMHIRRKKKEKTGFPRCYESEKTLQKQPT